jgi:RHS repeat-associated protein
MTSTVPNLTAAGLLNYDANDRITTDAAEQYDAAGNTTAAGTVTNVYDFENRLVQRGAVSVIYDGDGNRASKTAGGVTTKYLVDINNLTGYAQVLEELQSGSVVRKYTYGLDLISQPQASGTSYYGYDGHGSVRQLSNATGNVTDSYIYDAFGNLIERSGTTANVYLYAGEQFDPDLGLYYNRARFLDVRNDRFVSGDAFEGYSEVPVSLHRYVYAESNPLNRFDPSGYTSGLSNFAIGFMVEAFVAGQYPGCWNGTVESLSVGNCDFELFKRRPDLANTTFGDVFEVKPAKRFAEGRIQVSDYVRELRFSSRVRVNWHVGTQRDFIPSSKILPLPPGTPGAATGGLAIIGVPRYGVITYEVVDFLATILALLLWRSY